MSTRRVAALTLLGAVLELALLTIWQRNGYWDFSDGVYALSARELLHGLTPYRDFAAAQPPPVYLVGALLLAVHDGLASLRIGLGLLDVATAALVGCAVHRLTGRTGAAAVATLVAPLLPISLHEHAQLTPETLAAPLLLGGALWVGRQPDDSGAAQSGEAGCRAGGSPERAGRGALLLSVAVLCKLAFALPALAIALAAPAGTRRRAAAGLVAVTSVLALASFAAFGTAIVRQVVEAQAQVGTVSAHYALGLLAQAIWNEFPLVLLAAAALLPAAKARAREPELLRPLAADAAAGLILALTVLKRGSYINVLVVAEPPLLALAVAGGVWTERARRPAVAILGSLLALQSLSLLTSPADPWAATRPGASSGLARQASPDAIDRAVASAHRCPTGSVYAGTPYVAFLAARRVPGDQPDQFMLAHAAVDAAFAQRTAGGARCTA